MMINETINKLMSDSPWLQDKNANLQQQLEEHESQKHKMLQNSSKLDHQLQQITEVWSFKTQQHY